MKKFYLFAFLYLGALNLSAQTTLILNAPVYNNATTSSRGPNGTTTHSNLRGVFHITQSEMTVNNPTTSITSFGFNYNAGVLPTAVTGTLIVYFENSNDLTNLKSTTYTSAIAGMTTVFNNTMTIPNINAVTSLDLPLPTAFSYTGGTLYVAYEWICNGPYGTTAAIYQANNSIPNSGMTVNSSTASVPGTTLAYTAFRPSFRFGSVNTTTNDVSVSYVVSPAQLATINGTSHIVQAVVKNNSNTTLNNIPVSLNVSGAVSFASGFTVASLSAGNTASVTFPAFPVTAGLTGVNNIAVSVPSDQNNSNNIINWTQTLTCNNQSSGPPVSGTSFTNGIGFNTSSGLLLNRMRFIGTNTLTSVDIAISTATTNLGNNVYAVITNSLGTIIATSNTITLANPNLGVYNNFTFAPTPITANLDYYLGLAQPSNVVGYFPVASLASTAIITPSLTLYSSFIGGGTPSPQNPSLGFLGITANLQGTCAVLNPTANFSSPSPICASSTANFTNTSASATNYTWTATNATPNTSTLTNAAFTFSAAGIQTVTLLASNVSGTAVTVSTVNVGVAPVLTITAPNSVCAGNSVTLSATGASNYTWNPGNVTTSSIVATPTAITIFSVIGSNAGCTSMLFHTVNYIPSFTVNATSSSNSVCANTQVTLTASGATTYSWMPGSLTGSNVVVTPTNNTTYTLTGTNSGCNSNTTIAISTIASPTVSISSSATLLCIGNTATLSANGAISYTWNTSATTSVIAVSPTVVTIYTVTGAGANGCKSNAIFTQNVGSCAALNETNLNELVSLYPNPTSDYFQIELSGTFNVTIYDLLGKKVAYLANNFNKMKMVTTPFNKGAYLIEIERGNSKVVKKLIIE